MDSKRINFYAAGCDATVSFRKKQDENGKTTDVIFKAALSAQQGSVWGKVLGKIYYETSILAEIFNDKERSGYPHNGSEHSLTLIVRRDFFKKIGMFCDTILDKFLNSVPYPTGNEEAIKVRNELSVFLRNLRMAAKAIEVSAQEYRHHDSLYATNGFVCPKCGGNMFGTMSYPYFEKGNFSENNAILQKSYIRLGHCNKTFPSICGFKWDRDNQDQENAVIHFFDRDVYAFSYYDFIKKSTPEFAVDEETGCVSYTIPDELVNHPFLPYVKKCVFENIEDAEVEFQNILSALEIEKNESEPYRSNKKVREMNTLSTSFATNAILELFAIKEKDLLENVHKQLALAGKHFQK